MIKVVNEFGECLGYIDGFADLEGGGGDGTPITLSDLADVALTLVLLAALL
jgi:hypothetical protein